MASRFWWQVACLLTALLYGVDAGGSSFPYQDCTNNHGGDTSVLYCGGPNSIPNRYIVKFMDSVSTSDIVTHLQSVNATIAGTDCSFGNGKAPPINPNCTRNCTYPDLTSPQSQSFNGGSGFAIGSACTYANYTWQRANRTRPAQCGFNYIFDTNANGTTFRAYAAALSPSSLSTVLKDPLVNTKIVCLMIGCLCHDGKDCYSLRSRASAASNICDQGQRNL